MAHQQGQAKKRPNSIPKFMGKGILQRFEDNKFDAHHVIMTKLVKRFAFYMVKLFLNYNVEL